MNLVHSRRTGRLLVGRKLSSGWIGGAREMSVVTHGQHIHHLPQDADGLRLGKKMQGQNVNY